MKPGQNLFDPLFIREFSVELQIVSGTNSLDVGLGPDPEETSRSHALLLRQHPERSSTVPGTVADGLGIMVAIDLLSSRIIKRVGYNAVMFRIEAGDDRVMIGKSDGRIRGKHSFGCAGSLASEGEQMGGVITLRV